MATPILLVHGSFHTGRCWDDILPDLARHHLAVYTVTLSSHRGNATFPWRVTMGTYGNDVIAAATAICRPCVLLGHSMGGMVISEAAQRRPDLFSCLIYLSAFVPREGKSSVLNLAPVTPAMRSAAKASVFKGTATISRETARQVFYNRCNRATQERALALLCPQPMRAAISAISTTADGLGSVRKHYIECLDDQALPLSSQRAMQAHLRFESVQTIDSDHSPFFSKPEELAGMLARIAAPIKD